jgi:hypothetical protein
VQHAWLIDAHGHVVDPTWEDAAHCGYVGVPVNTAHMLKANKARIEGATSGSPTTGSSSMGPGRRPSGRHTPAVATPVPRRRSRGRRAGSGLPAYVRPGGREGQRRHKLLGAGS